MEIYGYTVPVPVVLLTVAAMAAMAWALFDLSRHDVRYLPKWAWALIVPFASFPLGAIAYFVLGRVPAGTVAVDSPGPPPPGPTPAPAVPYGQVLDREARPVADGAEAVVQTVGLTKVYGDAVALDRVDLAVPRGVTYGLIGPNGAGKTTLLSVLAGLRRPTDGELSMAVPRRSMGVLVDTPLFESWLTAAEVVDLARHLTAPELPPSRVDEVLAQVGLGAVADRRVGGFSRGMLQRLGLAGALVGDPEVLLLDEPSSALDPAGRREVLDLVGRLAHTKTVILSTHILSDVQQVADVVGVLDRGRLVFQGPLGELLARTSAAYSVHVRPPADPLVADLVGQPWVHTVDELAPGRIRLVVADPGTAEAVIPELVARHGLRLVAFNPATDLETAFLELTT